MVCSVLLRKKCIKKGEMEQARKKWDKNWGEVRRMAMTGPDVKIAPDSAVAGLEA